MTDDWGKRREEIQKLRAARLAKAGNSTNVVQFPSKPEPDEGLPAELAEAIPNASFTEEEKEDVAEHIQSADQQIEKLVEGIDILRAYDMWIGKMKPSPSPGSSEVFVSCPLPGHEDKNPSACANTDTNLWMCYRCQQGGDILDLAAIRYDMPDYKAGQNFHNLYRKIAENDFGWTFENENGFQVGSSPEDRAKKANAAEQRIIEERAQLEQQQGELPPKNVIDIETGEDVAESDELVQDFLDMPSLDWRPLVKEGTFLDYYMSECINDTSPEEYHFWNALTALSLAVGRNVQLGRLKSNIFVCHLGKSGVGKSQSMYPLKEVLKSIMPYDEKSPSPDGVFLVNGVQTGEGLVKDFMGEVSYPGKPPVQVGNVKGLVHWDEMSTIVVNSKRGNGNIIKQKLNEFYDCGSEITTRSASSVRIAVNPYACLSTSLQPDNLRDGLAKEDITSGFLNRFVFVTGTRKPQNAIEDYEYDLTKIKQSLTAIHLQYKNYDNVAMEYVPTQLMFSEESRPRWIDFHTKIVDPTVASGSGSVSRINALMKKLIMLFAINAKETQISLDSVERAIAMWDYLLGTYMAVDDRVSKTAISEMMDDILKISHELQMKTKSGVKYITANEILRHRRKYELRDVGIALEDLTRFGMMQKIAPEQMKKGRGRPPVGICYLPVGVGA